MVEARNSRALQALPVDGNTVMIWGADHLFGLRAGLEAAGLTRADRKIWLDVGWLPATWASARELWAAARQVKTNMAERSLEPGPAGTGS